MYGLMADGFGCGLAFGSLGRQACWEREFLGSWCCWFLISGFVQKRFGDMLAPASAALERWALCIASVE